MKYVTIFCILLLLSQSINATTKKNLNVVVAGTFRGELNPVKTYNLYEFALIACLSARLTKIDANGHITGDLLKSWTISNDKRKYTFVLDSSKGISANDVLNSLRTAILPESKIYHKSLFKALIKFESTEKWFKIINDQMFEISLINPYPSFLLLLSSPEFAIIPNKPDSFFPTGYELKKTLKNKDFVIERKNNFALGFPIIHLKVEADLQKIKSSFDRNEIDLLLGLSIKELSDFKLSNTFDLIESRFSNPTQFEFNWKKEIFSNIEFRKDLSSVILKVAKKWSQHKNLIKFHPFLIPPGFLPWRYYSNSQFEAEISELNFAQKWGSRITKYGLTFWISPKYTDEGFMSELLLILKKASKNINIIASGIDGRVDSNISGMDGGGFFQDPDSPIIIWSSNSNQPDSIHMNKFFDSVNEIRFNLNEEERLKNYITVINNFEKENWVVPIFHNYEPIIKRKNLQVPDLTFSPFELICRSKSSN